MGRREVECFSRFPRMWRAMFKRECIFIIPSHFSHKVIISSSSSSLPALSPMSGGWAQSGGHGGLPRGTGTAPPLLQPHVLRGELRPHEKGRDVSYNDSSETQKPGGWQWGSRSVLSETPTSSLEKDRCVPTQDNWFPGQSPQPRLLSWWRLLGGPRTTTVVRITR